VKKNNLRRNIGVLLTAFIIMFAGLIFYLGYVDIVYGQKWYATPYNPRIQGSESNVEAGDILDRTGQQLLYTKDGKRTYINDKSTRESIAHIIGDEYGFSNGAQVMYANYLYGTSLSSVDGITRLLSGNKIKGSNVTLTIDADLCDTAADALRKYNGAVVVMNYKTGEILASTSSPSFDPKDMSDFEKGGGTSELVNRAFSGLYPPGSTFKIITAAALIENGKTDYTTTCNGSTEIDGQEITCAEKHGKVDFKSAFTQSCNVYFAEAAQQIDPSALQTEAEKFLYNKKLNYGDIVLGTSLFEPGNNGSDEGWAAVGQYHDLVSPLQACMIASCIANDGTMMEPKLLYSVSNGSGVSYKLSPETAATPLSNTDELKDMMTSVVKKGTGTAAAIKGYTVAGKTGTAQIQNEKGDIVDDAWFVGFIRDDKHPIAVAVILEQAGSGGSKAAPVAQKVLNKALKLGY
jgi:penicillin-binding protein A